MMPGGSVGGRVNNGEIGTGPRAEGEPLVPSSHTPETPHQLVSPELPNSGQGSPSSDILEVDNHDRRPPPGYYL